MKIDSSELDSIEKNHLRDIDRQKTEVVKYWLRNSPDASWTTLAKAVEKMGGYARLVGRLKSKEIEKEQEKQNTSAIKVERWRERARPVTKLREKEQTITSSDSKEAKSEEKKQNTSAVKVERLRGRARFVDVVERVIRESRRQEKKQVLEQDLDEPIPRRRRKRTNSWELKYTGERRDILLLGKMGHGKSTLGNRMLDLDECFKINDQQCPQTIQRSAMLHSASQLKDYRVDVYDHNGFFEGTTSISALSSAVPSQLNLVVFVLKEGGSFNEKQAKFIIGKWQISGISVLILTHCERLSEEERGEMIEQLKKDHPSIAELMGKGILAVGFPDSSHIQPGSPLSQRVEEDKASLRQLIYSCDEVIPQNQQVSRIPGGPDLQIEWSEFTYHQSQRRWLYFGVLGCLCILCAYLVLKS